MCVPTDSVAILKVAVAAPPIELRLPWPMLMPASEKITVPVGVPEPLQVMVAIKTTVWPKTDGLADELTAVEVLAGAPVTVSLRPALLGAKRESPL